MENLRIPDKIQSLVYKKKKAQALWLLSELTYLIDNGLFAESERDFVRYINTYRVSILRNWGMYREALAFTCLECELYPENAKAFAFKEYLIEQIKNIGNNRVLKKNNTLKSSWKGVAGMTELKTIFERDIILLFTESEIYSKYRIPLPNGILLYGPPGCGKTFIARKLAEQIKFHFMEVTPADLGSTYVHGTQLEIKRVFDEAIKNKPTLLFFDEIEASVPNRNNSDVSFHYKSEVNEFLTQLDQCGKKGVFVVGATNYLRNIDPAIIRSGRFDKKIFVGPPDIEARIEALKIHMEGRPYEKIQWLFLAEMAEYFTFAEIENVVNEAARIAIKKNSPINTNILGYAISHNKPELNSIKINEYY